MRTASGPEGGREEGSGGGQDSGPEAVRATRAGPRAGAVAGAAAGRSPRAAHGARTPHAPPHAHPAVQGGGRAEWRGLSGAAPATGCALPVRRYWPRPACMLLCVRNPWCSRRGRNFVLVRCTRCAACSRLSQDASECAGGRTVSVTRVLCRTASAMLRGRAAHVLRAAASAASRATLTFSNPVPRHYARPGLAACALLLRARLPPGMLQKMSVLRFPPAEDDLDAVITQCATWRGTAGRRCAWPSMAEPKPCGARRSETRSHGVSGRKASREGYLSALPVSAVPVSAHVIIRRTRSRADAVDGG